MPVTPRDTFIVNLTKCGLLAEQQLADLRGEMEAAAEDEDAVQRFARSLIERRVLTAWQARMLLRGHTAFFLGKYKLLSELGRGGMGAVFKAEQAPLGRIVAVKVMARKLLNDQKAVARFHREIQAAAALVHPNVVAAFDADHVHNTHFLVMEYVEGEGLDAILSREQHLPIATACEYIRQAALGLEHAHSLGLAHRDIKPSNLLVTQDDAGQPIVKVLDMGLARFTSEIHDEHELTTTGQVMGTPDYIAPEQARNTKSADIRSDIYSLGCTLFRAITGRLPFEGHNVMEKLMARALSDAAPLRAFVPDAPEGLEAIVAKCLARDPAARFQTPRDVASALAPFSFPSSAPGRAAVSRPGPAVSGTTAPRPKAESDFADQIDPRLDQFLKDLAQEAIGVEERETYSSADAQTDGDGPVAPAADDRLPGGASRPVRKRGSRTERASRSSRYAYVVPLSVVAVLGLFLFGVQHWERSGRTTLTIDWTEAERLSATIEVDGKAATLPANGDLSFLGPPGRRTLKITRSGYEPIDEEWVLARGAEETFRPEFRPLPQAVRKTAWESLRDEYLVATKAMPGQTRKKQVAAAAPLREKLFEFKRKWPRSSESREADEASGKLPGPMDLFARDQIPPAELRAAGGGDQALANERIVAILGDSRLRHSLPVMQTVFAEGSLVSLGLDGLVQWWELDTGYARQTLHFELDELTAAALDSTGKTVIAGTKPGAVYRVDLPQAQPEFLFDLEQPVSVVAVSPRATMIAVGGSDGKLEVGDQTARRYLAGHTQRVNCLAFSPDGLRLASGSDDGTLRLWDIETGELIRVIEEAAKPVRAVAFDSAGERLAAARDRIDTKVWRLAAFDLECRIEHPDEVVACLAFAPNGRRLALGRERWETTVYNLPSGEETATFRFRSRDVGASTLAFSPDGQTLAAGSGSGAMQLWDLARAPRFERESHETQIHAAVVSPNGAVIASASWDRSLAFWDVARRDLKRLETDVMSFDLLYAPDGRLVVGGDSAVHVADHEGFLVSRRPRSNWVFSVAVSADGKKLASGGYAISSVTNFETDAPIRIAGLDDPQAPYRGYAFTPNGRFVASRKGTDVHVWDTTTGRLQRQLTGHPAVASVFLDDERLLIGTIDGGLAVWNISTSKVNVAAETFPHGGELRLSLSPDRTTAVTTRAGRSETIVLWDVTQDPPSTLGSEIRVTPPGVPVWRSEFAPDGRHLVIANGNGTIYVLRLKEWSPDER